MCTKARQEYIILLDHYSPCLLRQGSLLNLDLSVYLSWLETNSIDSLVPPHLPPTSTQVLDVC